MSEEDRFAGMDAEGLRRILGELLASNRAIQANLDKIQNQFPIQPSNTADSIPDWSELEEGGLEPPNPPEGEGESFAEQLGVTEGSFVQIQTHDLFEFEHPKAAKAEARTLRSDLSSTGVPRNVLGIIARIPGEGNTSGWRLSSVSPTSGTEVSVDGLGLVNMNWSKLPALAPPHQFIFSEEAATSQTDAYLFFWSESSKGDGAAANFSKELAAGETKNIQYETPALGSTEIPPSMAWALIGRNGEEAATARSDTLLTSRAQGGVYFEIQYIVNPTAGAKHKFTWKFAKESAKTAWIIGGYITKAE